MWGIIALIGAFLYRLRGGMPPSFPRPVDQLLFAVPYGLVTGFYWDNIFAGLIIWVITAGALCLGHGNNMDLGEQDAGDEVYEV